jgi:nucleotide-binding universal stress UspA family protein
VSRILVATDGSDCAQHAATEAVRLLGTDNEFVALTVSAMPAVAGAAAVTPAAEISLGPEEIEALDEAASDAAHVQVERTAELLRSAGASQVQTTTVEGEPGVTICEAAKELSADVIVVGNTGAGLLSRMLTGSVSTYVVHHAERPVLVVRQ